jgi:hypothetical protein
VHCKQHPITEFVGKNRSKEVWSASRICESALAFPSVFRKCGSPIYSIRDRVKDVLLNLAKIYILIPRHPRRERSVLEKNPISVKRTDRKNFGIDITAKATKLATYLLSTGPFQNKGTNQQPAVHKETSSFFECTKYVALLKFYEGDIFANGDLNLCQPRCNNTRGG